MSLFFFPFSKIESRERERSECGKQRGDVNSCAAAMRVRSAFCQESNRWLEECDALFPVKNDAPLRLSVVFHPGLIHPPVTLDAHGPFSVMKGGKREQIDLTPQRLGAPSGLSIPPAGPSCSAQAPPNGFFFLLRRRQPSSILSDRAGAVVYDLQDRFVALADASVKSYKSVGIGYFLYCGDDGRRRRPSVVIETMFRRRQGLLVAQGIFGRCRRKVGNILKKRQPPLDRINNFCLCLDPSRRSTRSNRKHTLSPSWALSILFLSLVV